ncbi:ABC transporter permease [Propionibacterium sp.]|uniref:ABC transporter permease n=1 Tax=Propionibacterium sp. TaxID=1977903 RepID=UPI0039E853B4
MNLGVPVHRVLLRLALRRDALMIGIVTVLIWLMSYYSARTTRDLYPDQNALVAVNAASNASVGVVAMYGRVHDLSSAGGIGANKLAMIDMIALSFLVIAVLRRHTRSDEETGRTELLGATSGVRTCALRVSTALAAIVSLVCGIGTGLCLWAGGWQVTGSMLLGLAQAGVGLSSTGLAAVAMQFSSSTRTCSMWAYACLALAFVLRMIGDVAANRGLSWLSWLSPIGWAQQVRPYDGDRSWVLMLPLVLCIALVMLSHVLSGHRDLGAGLVPGITGTPDGRIGSVFGLAWKLQQGTFLGWLLAYLGFGVLVGAIMGSLTGLLDEGSEQLFQALGGAGHMGDLYISLVTSFATFGAAAFGVSSVLQLRAEETRGHLEAVLARPVTRVRFAWSHLWLALAGPVLLLAGLGAALATVHTLVGGSTGWWREFSPGLVMLPGVWLLTALTLAGIAWVPRAEWLGWALLGWMVVVQELGRLMKFPHWLMQTSPLALLPKLPVDAMNWVPVVWLCIASAAMVAVGLAGYRRRDIPVG